MTTMDDLPEEILLQCISRLPRRSMARAKAVCKRWNAMLSDSGLLYDVRQRMGSTEAWSYAVKSIFQGRGGGIEVRGSEAKAEEEEGGGGRGEMAVLGGVPPRLQFAATAGGDGRRIYVMGGRSPMVSSSKWLVFRDVHAFDAVACTWQAASSMAHPRFAFAAAPLHEHSLAVAGGYDSHGLPLQTAEIYDVRADIWKPIPPMRRLSGACRGCFALGKFYVLMANQNHHHNLLPLITNINNNNAILPPPPPPLPLHNNNNNNGIPLAHHSASPFVEAYDPLTRTWSSSSSVEDDLTLLSLLHPSSPSSFTHPGPLILHL